MYMSSFGAQQLSASTSSPSALDLAEQAWNFAVSDRSRLHTTSMLGERTLGISSLDLSNHLLVAASDDDVLYTVTSMLA